MISGTALLWMILSWKENKVFDVMSLHREIDMLSFKSYYIS